MTQLADEWFRQAEYDLDVARLMHAGARHSYAVFMCHLAVEKALKGLYQTRKGTVPPKTHNLIYLLKVLDAAPDEETKQFLATLTQAYVATRYPDNLETLQERYTEAVAQQMIARTEEALAWIRTLQ